MEEIFVRCFAGKTFKLTTKDQDCTVSFMGLDNIVVTNCGDCFEAAKLYVKSHSGQKVIHEKYFRSFQMSNIQVLGDRKLAATVDMGDYYYKYGDEKLTTWKFTYLLSEDLKTVKEYSEEYYNAQGHLLQSGFTADGKCTLVFYRDGRVFDRREKPSTFVQI